MKGKHGVSDTGKIVQPPYSSEYSSYYAKFLKQRAYKPTPHKVSPKPKNITVDSYMADLPHYAGIQNRDANFIEIFDAPTVLTGLR
ncbi:MAG: hypothetical protein WB586_26835 [Chthoniobacterales bacterium]